MCNGLVVACLVVAAWSSPVSVRLGSGSNGGGGGAAAFGLPIEFCVESAATAAASSSQAIGLLAHQTPLDGVEADIFEVVDRHNRAARYIGMIAKRAAPTDASFVFVGVGETRCAAVDLALTYEVQPNTEYVVAYKQAVELRARNHRTPTLPAITLAAVDLSAETVTHSASVLPAPESLMHAARVRANRGNDDGGANGLPWACTPNEITIVKTAVNTSVKACRKGWQDIDAAKIAAINIFVTWFGPRDDGRMSTVSYNMYYIDRAYSIENFTISCKPTACKPSVYAFVYPNDVERNVNLCQTFFDSPLLPTPNKLDPMINTLPHEMGHFWTVSNLRDLAYGEAECKRLATQFPRAAVGNADSHGYFAQYVYGS